MLYKNVQCKPRQHRNNQKGTGEEAKSNSSHKQEISFVAHSPYLCIIKEGGASPEYMSDTAPLLATVNMLDINRRGFLKTKRIHNEQDCGIEAELDSI